MAFPSEMGLRLLLCPLGSNIVIRTACCSVGIGLPVYSTFKAIEKKDEREQQRWLVYWAAYGSLSIAELFTDKFISWIPFYYPAKFAFLVWLQLPSSNGSKRLYMSHLRPFLLRHQERLDQIVEYIYREMSTLVNTYEAELQFAKTVIVKALEYANGIVKDAINPPAQRQAIRAINDPTPAGEMQDSIEGPTPAGETRDSESDNER